jgi:hypothetical protein
MQMNISEQSRVLCILSMEVNLVFKPTWKFLNLKKCAKVRAIMLEI